MKINEGYKEKGKGRKCNETNEEKDSRMVDDSRTGAQCGDSAYAGRRQMRLRQPQFRHMESW